VEMQFISDRAD